MIIKHKGHRSKEEIERDLKKDPQEDQSIDDQNDLLYSDEEIIEDEAFEDETPEEEEENFEEEVDAAEEEQLKHLSMFESAFYDVILENYDISLALHRAKKNFTNALLKRGITVNPEEMYEYLNSTTEKLIRLSTVKRLCMALGLHGELDKILEKEMQSSGNSSFVGKYFGKSNIVGERKDSDVE